MKKIVTIGILFALNVNIGIGREQEKCKLLENTVGYKLVSNNDQFMLVNNNFAVEKQKAFTSKTNINFNFSIILTLSQNQNKMTEWLLHNKESKLKTGLKPFYKGLVEIYEGTELVETICFESKDKKFIRKRYASGEDRILIYNKTDVADNLSNTKEYGAIFDNENIFLLDDLVVFSSQYDIEKIKNIIIRPYIYIDNPLDNLQFGYYFDAKISKAKSSPKFLSNEPDFLLYGSKTYDSNLFERSKPKHK